MRQAVLGALGIALFLALWEVVGRTQVLGISWPPLSDVLEMLGDPARLPLFRRALEQRPAAGLGQHLQDVAERRPGDAEDLRPADHLPQRQEQRDAQGTEEGLPHAILSSRTPSPVFGGGAPSYGAEGVV